MPRIAIFDSGVGGLSIYQAVRAAKPEFDYVFVSDNHAFPYGTKTEDELVDRVVAVVTAIIERVSPDILIVACNTASTVVLPLLRQQHTLPIIGVVPAIKPAAAVSNTKHIGLLATPATVSRAYTDALIRDYANDCRVTKIGSSELVELAEQKLHGATIDLRLLEKVIKPVIDEPSIDTLILACTHFPLLVDELTQVLLANDRRVSLLDSRTGIAKRVMQLADKLPQANINDSPATSSALFTDRISEASEYSITLMSYDFKQIGVLNL